MLKGHPWIQSVYTKYRIPIPATVIVRASELPDFGWLRFVELGEENAYFATVHGYTLCVKQDELAAYKVDRA
jgi:hypothetical protein